MSRLAQGGLIDRTSPLNFSFDGRVMQGFAGDTLASALVANGVKLVGRSFKYHRPRGILTAGAEEPNALVTLRTGARAEPNTRATTAQLFDGLVATSQNRWPSLELDLMSINQWAAPLLAAGFYYKTFMWPAAFWEKVYEPLIRRAAGLGALSGLADPDIYDRDHVFCDLLVIGAGPAGLAAALTAGRAGLRVVIADEDWRPGGRLLCERRVIEDAPGHAWAETAAEELTSLGNVRYLARTSVFGLYDGREYGAVERLTDHLPSAPVGRPRQRLWKIVAKRTLLATGAIERPLVFGGNDRPGVMTASAVSTYLNRFAAAPGRRAVVFTTSDSGWSTACDLIDAGVEVAAVVDARNDPATADRARVLAAGVPIMTGAVVADALGRRLNAVRVKTRDGGFQTLPCDLLAVAGGWSPAIGLANHMGARPIWSPETASFVVDKPPLGLTAIGAAAGRWSLSDALADGGREAARIAADLGYTAKEDAPPRTDDEAVGVEPLWRVAARRTKAFVDFQNDVTDSDIALAAREGFTSVEHLKRYTTLGMATDQGKTSQLNALGWLAQITGKPIDQAGSILARPPHNPVAIGLFAGPHRDQHFRPERRTPSHDWAVEQGASFTDAGQWKRAQWFARPGERDWLETVNREVNAVRSAVGVCDVSTLGKIDVHGPDAAVLLDRLYANPMASLAVGKVRYGLMLREDGLVMDDGTVSRLGEHRFFVTTTTVNAAKVMQHIDYARQVLWPTLDVQACSVTEQWATFAVAGPKSRALLQELAPDADLSDAALPYMGLAQRRWRGVAMRIFRVSFSGELAYEVSVPSTHGDALIRAVFEAGSPFGVTAYGTEALGVMRVEKGHPAGAELNGQTTAGDLGLSRLMSSKKDYIGRTLASRPGLTDPDRPTLVGLRPATPGARIRAGAHLLASGAQPVAANDQGYVTSAAYSPTLGHWIALALLQRGPARHGERIIVHDPVRGGDVEADVCSPVFVDPKGERLSG
jgi:sarcosine oxidase subunit alpha